MSLPKWTKNSLISMKKYNYNIIHCVDEKEALELKSKLKEMKMCAQAGYVINRENEDIYFILIKRRDNSPLENKIDIGGIEKKVYTI